MNWDLQVPKIENLHELVFWALAVLISMILRVYGARCATREKIKADRENIRLLVKSEQLNKLLEDAQWENDELRLDLKEAWGKADDDDTPVDYVRTDAPQSD